MPDLFTSDLSKLTLSDVTDFLGLNGPEELRPPEGTRIDFKRELRPEIGATVSVSQTHSVASFSSASNPPSAQNRGKMWRFLLLALPWAPMLAHGSQT